MKRWLAQGLALSFLAFGLSTACGNSSTGGPPQTPCTDDSKTPLFCGSACLNKCGCSDCTAGQTKEIGGTWYECSGKCLQPLQSSSGGSGGGNGGSTAGGGSGGTDCSSVNCANDPPICGQCTTCACCTCTPNDLQDIGGTAYLCTAAQCWEPVVDGG